MARPVSMSRLGLMAVLATTLGLGACGSSDDESSIEAIDGSRQVEEPNSAPATSTTIIATTTTTTIVATTTVPIETTSLPPAQAVRPELCEAITAFYVTGRTTDFIVVEDPFALEVTFRAIRMSIDEVVRVGEGSTIAAPWVELNQVLDVIDGLSAIGWDVSLADDLPNELEISNAFGALGDQIDRTAEFLISDCRFTQVRIDELDAGAEGLADEIRNDATPDRPEPIEITDDTGRITMIVPGDWTDIVRSPQGNVSRLAAAPDFDAFDTSFGADGGFVLAVDAADPDAWRPIFDAAVDGLVADGCVRLGEVPYDDGLYVGAESGFDCGVAEKTLDLFGGRDPAGSVAVIGQITRPVDDRTARDTIVESFLIS